MLGATPENLWGNTEAMTLADEDSEEAADIFALAMKNNFDVGGYHQQHPLWGILIMEVPYDSCRINN